MPTSYWAPRSDISRVVVKNAFSRWPKDGERVRAYVDGDMKDIPATEGSGCSFYRSNMRDTPEFCREVLEIPRRERVYHIVIHAIRLQKLQVLDLIADKIDVVERLDDGNVYTPLHYAFHRHLKRNKSRKSMKVLEKIVEIGRKNNNEEMMDQLSFISKMATHDLDFNNVCDTQLIDWFVGCGVNLENMFYYSVGRGNSKVLDHLLTCHRPKLDADIDGWTSYAMKCLRSQTPENAAAVEEVLGRHGVRKGCEGNLGVQD
jgi:hypothetical protein